MRTCEHDGCDTTVTISSRAYCPPHFQRWLAGLPMDAPTADMRGIPVEVRFWRRVDKTDACWLWTGPLFDGYGRIKNKGGTRTIYVHKLAYEWANGPVPDGLVVDHKCRTRHCVRPDHLHVVTRALNAQNRSRQGIGRSGARGVSWHAATQSWWARVGDGKGGRISAGRFSTIEEAVAAATTLRNQVMTNNLQDRVA